MVNRTLLIVSEDLAFVLSRHVGTDRFSDLIGVQDVGEWRCNVRCNKRVLKKYNRQTLLSMLHAGEICVIVLPFVG